MITKFMYYHWCLALQVYYIIRNSFQLGNDCCYHALGMNTRRIICCLQLFLSAGEIRMFLSKSLLTVFFLVRNNNKMQVFTFLMKNKKINYFPISFLTLWALHIKFKITSLCNFSCDSV